MEEDYEDMLYLEEILVEDDYIAGEMDDYIDEYGHLIPDWYEVWPDFDVEDGMDGDDD